MKPFSLFLTEAAEVEGKLTHLEHAEDEFINRGQQGFHGSTQGLLAMHNKLRGAPSTATVTTKYDGSPSLVFGHNPDNGKFFVASKSAFNKNPKINYTHDDIDKNHGHAPGLAEKLHTALDNLEKTAPREGVFQGDVMYTKSDVEKAGPRYRFTPNTITYSTPVNSEHGKKIAKANIGLVVHTKYHGDDFERMQAQPISPQESKQFHPHEDVHLIQPHVTRPVEYSDQQQKEFKSHLDNAIALHKQSSNIHGAVEPHRDQLKTYINSTVRDQSVPTREGYVKFIRERHQKEIDKVKTQKSKDAKTEIMNHQIKHVESNKSAFNNAFKLHHHIQQAKDVLVHALSASPEFEHSIGGKKAKPEGFVMSHQGRPMKLVDRAEFSRANFEASKNRKKPIEGEI